MKKFLKYAVLLMILPVFFLSSCEDEGDDPPPAPSNFETMTEYMATNGLDLDDILTDWITTAEAINAKNVDEYYIIDIRKSEDFANGRIPGAVNTTLGNVLTEAQNAGTKPIIVVCYTGQSAGHAVCALRLSGYTNAKVLKWGMSSWHEDFDSWSDKVNTENSPNWEAAPGDIVDNITYNEVPEFSATSTTGEGILAERVEYMLSNGFKGIENGNVLNDPTQYFINNYWDEGDVTQYGNIKSAFRVKPWTLENKNYNNIDVSEQVVTYCWTGQTSSMITAYFTVLGYDAVSLKFGVNSIIYDNLTGHKWNKDTQCMNYPYETK